MNNRIEKVKKHLKDNKVTYIVGVGCTVVGAAVAVIVIGRTQAGTAIAQKVTVIGVGNRVNATVITFVENSTPSKPVHLVGTDLYFNSLSEAARKTGHHLSALSRHINGHSPDVNGDVFEILKTAA